MRPAPALVLYCPQYYTYCKTDTTMELRTLGRAPAQVADTWESCICEKKKMPPVLLPLKNAHTLFAVAQRNHVIVHHFDGGCGAPITTHADPSHARLPRPFHVLLPSRNGCLVLPGYEHGIDTRVDSLQGTTRNLGDATLRTWLCSLAMTPSSVVVAFVACHTPSRWRRSPSPCGGEP